MLVYEGYSIQFQYAYSLDVLPRPNKIGSVPRIPISQGCSTYGRCWVSRFLFNPTYELKQQVDCLTGRGTLPLR